LVDEGSLHTFFYSPIYDALRKIDTDMTTLYLVYEMWDSMIENVRKVIFQHERKIEVEHSSLNIN